MLESNSFCTCGRFYPSLSLSLSLSLFLACSGPKHFPTLFFNTRALRTPARRSYQALAFLFQDRKHGPLRHSCWDSCCAFLKEKSSFSFKKVQQLSQQLSVAGSCFAVGKTKSGRRLAKGGSCTHLLVDALSFSLSRLLPLPLCLTCLLTAPLPP